MRWRLISECKEQTGFAGIKDPEFGCSRRRGFKRTPSVPFPIPVMEQAKCKCLQLFGVMHRHAEFGFNPEMFLHDIDDIALADRKPLDDYLSNPKDAWQGRGLFIFGNNNIGTGKTTLAHLVTKSLYIWGEENGFVSGTYKTWYMLSSEFADRAWKGRDGFKEVFNWGGEYGEQTIDLWSVTGIVVLDELGREDHDDRKTKSGRAMLEFLLRDRFSLPTIIVSHIIPANASKILSSQAVSLLSKMAVVEVVGDDRRVPDGRPFYG